MAKRFVVVGVLAVLLAAGVVFLVTSGGSGYQVKLVLPSAAQVVEQAPVRIDGAEVGSVEKITVKDGMAIVTLNLNERAAPLREGTTSRVAWESLLGERVIILFPGPAENAAYPDGALIEADSAQIEVDEFLAIFDEPTRERLNTLISGLNGTVQGREAQLQATLRSAGPTVNALGEVLQAVGRDGPAIRELITELQQVTGPLAARQNDVRGVVDRLTTFSAQLAPLQAQIRDGFQELPVTLDVAKETLDLVPPAVDASVPLLEDLRSPTDKLPSIAENLSPLLRDLRPTLDDLGPTLVSLADLLDQTPDFLDTTSETFPQLEKTVREYQPVLAFLRPYTPELVGFATNWGNVFSGYDSQGHVWTALPSPFGFSENDDQLGGGFPAGIVNDPAPGHLVEQPWTDANGSEMR